MNARMQTFAWKIVLAGMLLQPAGFLLGAEPPDALSWWQRQTRRLSWEETVRYSRNPRDIVQQVKRRVEYRANGHEQWRSGRATWSLQYGDCKAIATAITELSRLSGMHAEVYVIYADNHWNAHAVAMGKHEGRLWVANNGHYETYSSVEAVKHKIAREIGLPVTGTIRIAPLAELDVRTL